jgi:hypothetical protein
MNIERDFYLHEGEKYGKESYIGHEKSGETR